VFYMALPFGAGVTSLPEPGHDNGAPTKPYLKIKIIITTVIAIILTVIIVYIIDEGYLGRFATEYTKWVAQISENI
jgi:predicted secreted protein